MGRGKKNKPTGRNPNLILSSFVGWLVYVLCTLRYSYCSNGTDRPTDQCILLIFLSFFLRSYVVVRTIPRFVFGGERGVGHDADSRNPRPPSRFAVTTRG